MNLRLKRGGSSLPKAKVIDITTKKERSASPYYDARARAFCEGYVAGVEEGIRDCIEHKATLERILPPLRPDPIDVLTMLQTHFEKLRQASENLARM